MSQFLNTPAEIEAWLHEKEIKEFYLVPSPQYGYVVNCVDSVNLSWQKLERLSVKFHKVAGDFLIGNNQLTTLEGCPDLVGKSFYAGDNQLSNLEFCPKIITGHFSLIYNQISTLEFFPQSVRGVVYLNRNSLLGDIQEINDFATLYQKHKEIHIAKEKYFLQQAVASKDSVHSLGVANKVIKI